MGSLTNLPPKLSYAPPTPIRFAATGGFNFMSSADVNPLFRPNFANNSRCDSVTR